MANILVDIQSHQIINELLDFLKIKGVKEPLIIDENLEDEHLSKLMDEADRGKKVSLNKLLALRD